MESVSFMIDEGLSVLFLGPPESALLPFLRQQEKKVIQTMDSVGLSFLKDKPCDFLISYGYRHIISSAVLQKFPNRAINLHISMLPWNRGADPNFWSFVESSPKGVTIHCLDKGIDTGDILVQQEIHFAAEDTLRTSYECLKSTIEALFMKHWPSIRSAHCRRLKQEGKGSFHRQRDKQLLAHLLSKGWDTPVSVLEEYAKSHGLCIDAPDGL